MAPNGDTEGTDDDFLVRLLNQTLLYDVVVFVELEPQRLSVQELVINGAPVRLNREEMRNHGLDTSNADVFYRPKTAMVARLL